MRGNTRHLKVLAGEVGGYAIFGAIVFAVVSFWMWLLESPAAIWVLVGGPIVGLAMLLRVDQLFFLGRRQ